MHCQEKENKMNERDREIWEERERKIWEEKERRRMFRAGQRQR